MKLIVSGWLAFVSGLALAHGPSVFKADNLSVKLDTTQAFVYVTLVNQEAKPVKVVAAETPVSKWVELRQGNKRIKTLQIPAKGKLELRPEGYAIALLKLNRILRAGDLIPIILRLDDGDVFALLIEVKP